MALASLYLNRLRSLLSILGIVFGVMAVIIIISVGEGAKIEALRQIERLGTRNVYIQSVTLTEEKKKQARQSHIFGLTLKDARRIENGCKTVVNTAGIKTLNVSVMGTPQEITPQVISVTPSYSEILMLKIKSGRFISKQDVMLHKEVCIIGHDVSTALGKYGHIGAILRVENHLFKIVGILDRYHKNTDDTGTISARNYNEMVLLPMGFEAWLGKKRTGQKENQAQGLTELILQVDTPEHVLNAAMVIKRIMKKNHPDVHSYQIVTPLELLNQTRKTKKMFSLFLLTIASVSLVVGGIGIMNIMLATVSERKREIGIRRAVGANKIHILIQFLTESAILTMAGGIIGICVGVFSMFILSYFIPWESALTAKAIFVPLIISSLTGLCSGIYPAWSAANLDPIEALRI